MVLAISLEFLKNSLGPWLGRYRGMVTESKEKLFDGIKAYYAPFPRDYDRSCLQ